MKTERKIQIDIKNINDQPIKVYLTKEYSAPIQDAAQQIICALKDLRADRTRAILDVAINKLSDFSYISVKENNL